jgi:hypothetical protein
MEPTAYEREKFDIQEMDTTALYMKLSHNIQLMIGALGRPYDQREAEREDTDLKIIADLEALGYIHK